jgi:DNA-binding transcriptional regulator GbsR (MarR family)
MPRKPRGPSHEELLEWVERIATYLNDQDRMPLIAGRVLGWLMICDPPEQSAAQLAEAIGASRASLTTNLRLLHSIGFLRKLTRPGEPTAYYRAEDDAFARMLQKQAESVNEFVEITRDGLGLVGPSTERAARIRKAQELFDWLAKLFADAPPPPGVDQSEWKDRKGSTR